MNSSSRFSAWEDDLEFLLLLGDGTIITRHRRDAGLVHVHRQQHDLFPSILEERGPLDAWRAGILTLSKEAQARGCPACIAVLCHRDHPSDLTFVFPFTALSEEAAEQLLVEVPAILLLVHDSRLSCHTDRLRRHPPYDTRFSC